MYLRQRLPLYHRLVRDLCGVRTNLCDGYQIPLCRGNDCGRHTILPKYGRTLDADNHGMHQHAADAHSIYPIPIWPRDSAT